MRSISSIILTILVLLGSQASYAAAVPSDISPAIQKLDSHIQATLKKKIIPGCAVAIIHKNQVVFINGYGSRVLGKSEKVDPDTVFQLGSVSKPIAATLASLLESKGLIKLDAPVSDYIPEFTLNTTEDRRHLKVKNILSHSSGVPRAGFNNLIESYASYDTIMKALQKAPVRCQIGKKYDYNNAMFSLLTVITKKATNQTFSKSLSENLLQPLNMTRTSSNLEGIVGTANRACPHTRTKKGLIPCGSYSSSYYTVAPAGGINSSARDMAQFLKAQMGGNPQVLSSAVLARIHAPQIATKNMLQSQATKKMPIKQAQYGMGWRITNVGDEKLIFHGGWVKGFTNFIGFLPDHDVGIVILHNGDSKFSARTAMQFFESLLKTPKTSIIPGLGKSANKNAGKKGLKPTKISKNTSLKLQIPKTVLNKKINNKTALKTLLNNGKNKTPVQTTLNKKTKNKTVKNKVNTVNTKKAKNKTA